MVDLPAVVPVIQIDRVHAAQLGIATGRWSRSNRQAILDGVWDGCADVQMFARHRLTVTGLDSTQLLESERLDYEQKIIGLEMMADHYKKLLMVRSEA